MKLSNLTLVVTDDCNFNCSYCNQEKEKKYLENTTIKKAVDFFYPFFTDDKDAHTAIVFYGGEPLLAFEQIEYAVSLLQEKNRAGKKKIKFVLPTNGSLVTEKMLRFFSDFKFGITLSYDGLAQETCRNTRSREKLRELIGRALSPSYPGIEFSINSVFTPATISHFSESLRYIVELGVPEVRFSFNGLEPWDRQALKVLEDEFNRLADYLLSYYKEKGTIPVTFFRGTEADSKKGFSCTAARDRFAVSPGGDVWGCYLFYGFLKDKRESQDFQSYSFGKLADFIKNFDRVYPKIADNHAVLRQSSFFTEERFCFLCDKVKECGNCPVYTAHSSSFIGKIPAWFCSLSGIKIKAKERFLGLLSI